jgi:hypothetical protein
MCSQASLDARDEPLVVALAAVVRCSQAEACVRVAAMLVVGKRAMFEARSGHEQNLHREDLVPVAWLLQPPAPGTGLRADRVPSRIGGKAEKLLR